MSVVTHFEATRRNLVIPKKGLLRRFLDRIVAAQEARVATELKRHSHLLPRELDQITWKIGERSEDSLPFLR